MATLASRRDGVQQRVLGEGDERALRGTSKDQETRQELQALRNPAGACKGGETETWRIRHGHHEYTADMTGYTNA